MSKNDLSNPAARANWNAYQRAKQAGHDDFVVNAKKCDRFYIGGGEQWDPADRSYLENLGKPVLEVNLILSTVNALLGEQTSQRVDMVYKPKKKAAQATADALTAVGMAIQDDNMFDWVEAQVFSDGVIQDRGYFDVRIDFSKDITGEVRITSEDPVNILLDPDAKEYDPSTWNEVLKTKWMTLDEVAEQYGKKMRDRLSAFTENTVTFGSDSVLFEEQTFGEHAGWEGEFKQDGNRDIRRVRVIERQFKRIGEIRYFIDNETGDMSEVPELVDDDRAQEIANQYGLSITKKRAKKIRWTVSCDGVVLSDEWSIYRSFTIIPYFPYFRRGRPFGVVRNLLSPQEQLNKIESQELHIINTTSNSGYTVEAGSLVNMTVEELEERGAETGLVLVHTKGSEPPAKIKPNSVPTGIDRMSQKTAASIREISGVREEMLGATSPEVSGVQLKAAQGRGLTQMQVPFDNLSKTRHFVAQKVLELVQDFYTETRVFKVVDMADPAMRQKEVTIHEPQQDGSFLNDITLGEYSITISTAPARDSLEESQFAEAVSLREAGVAVPDDVIIENSHLSRKTEVAERVRQMQGMGDPTPEQQALAKLEQQMTIQRAQLELGELEGKVLKLQADAALAQAKAAREGHSGEEFQAEMEVKIMALRLQARSKAAELQTSLELAGLHTQSNKDVALHSNLTKRTIGELGNRTQIEVAGLKQKAPALPNKSATKGKK